MVLINLVLHIDINHVMLETPKFRSWFMPEYLRRGQHDPQSRSRLAPCILCIPSPDVAQPKEKGKNRSCPARRRHRSESSASIDLIQLPPDPGRAPSLFASCFLVLPARPSRLAARPSLGKSQAFCFLPTYRPESKQWG
jgi:hypothetical protein